MGRRHQFLDFPDANVVGIRFALRRHGLPCSKSAWSPAFSQINKLKSSSDKALPHAKGRLSSPVSIMLMNIMEPRLAGR
jgi:hypothetical protein